MRQIFRIARQVAPTVIFFDQLDAIAPVRGAHAGSMTTDRVVSQLLAELDGVEQLSRVIVLGATNRIDLIDPSILRPGRFGVHIPVRLPDEGDRRAILRLHLGGKAMEQSTDRDKIATALAARTSGFSGARLRHVCQEAKRLALRGVRADVGIRLTMEHALEALEADIREHQSGAAAAQ